MLAIPAAGIGRIARSRPAAVRTHAWAAHFPLLLFPLALWWVATLFFGGDVGRLSDDYEMLRRDPVTGVLDLPAVQTPDRPYFIRPVFLFVAHNLITIFHGHEWVVHAFMAGVHGLVALLLYSVLRRARVGTLAATSAALLFLVLPQNHEAVFWMSAMGSEAALATFLILALVVVRQESRGLASLGLPFVLAFSVPCWNEQAAAAVPALPLLFLAVRRADQPFRPLLRHALVITGVCMAGVGLYLALLIGTTPAGQRGSASSLISAAELLPRWGESISSSWNWTAGQLGRDVVIGGLIRASRELDSVRAAVALALLVVGGVLFALRWARPRDAEGPPAASAPRLVWLALFGLFAALLTLLPAAVIREQPLFSRLYAVHVAGLALVAGSAFACLERARGSRSGRWVAGTAGAAVAVGTSVLAFSMIGLQGLFRDTARFDRSIPEQLAALMPGPERGTVFVPLDARAWAGDTGRKLFDGAIPLALFHEYAIGPLTREVFRRPDLDVVPFNTWRGLRLSGFTADTLVVPCPVSDGVAGKFRRTRIPWSRTVPFVIDEDGDVELVRRVWIERPNGRDLAIAETRVPAGVAAEPTFVIATPDGPLARTLDGWRRCAPGGGGELVPTVAARAFGLTRPVLQLGAAGVPARVAVELAAHPAPSHLVFRIASPDDAPPASEMVVRCRFESEPGESDGTLLAQRVFSCADLYATGRWMPFVVDVGRLDAPRTLCLEIAPGPDGGGETLLVTPGLRCPRELDRNIR